MKETRRKRRILTKAQRQRQIIFRCCLSILIPVLIIDIIYGLKLRGEHYRKNTIISGVDCSWLTVTEAEEKINSEISEKSIYFFFPDEICVSSGKDFDLRANSAQLAEILSQQNNGDKTRNFQLEDSFYLNTDKLEKVLKTMNSFKPENIIEAKNAYLTFDETSNRLTIIPEEVGFKFDFSDVHNLAYMCLKDGITSINFTGTEVQPEIVSTDSALNSQKDNVNKILSATINFSLIDGSTITLDKNFTKHWLVQDENGNYEIDIDSNLQDFLTLLSEKSYEANLEVEFNATDFGTVTVTVPQKNRLSLDFEKELEQIKTELQTGETITRSPIYSNDKSFENLQNYVEIDTSRQTVWMYYEGECIVETPCVTGNLANGYDTPSGWFYLTYKTTDDYLEGYNKDGSKYKSFVNYWMPFNGGIGLHDATWRKISEFGGNTYKRNGSHGCINLPLEAAKTIYEHIDSSMPIIVYASETDS